eukprot:scaffold72871_cov30-Tisochrysis_lutea.AAC.1
MTHAAAFSLSAELSRALQAACEGEAVGGLQIRIVDETFALTATLPAAPTAQQLHGAVQPLLDEALPCFFLLRIPARGWALASWVPDASNVRDRMLYSSGREALRKRVASLTTITLEVHWAVAVEADAVALFAETVNETATHSLLTEVEKLALADAKATAAEAAAGKVTSAALAFPLTANASDALSVFEKGGRDLLLLRIEGEQVDLLDSPTKLPTAPAPLEALLPTDSPCYALLRFPWEVNLTMPAKFHGLCIPSRLLSGTHVSAQPAAASTCSSPRFRLFHRPHRLPSCSHSQGTKSLVFVYSCPEMSAVRSKMLHASCKGALLTTLSERGLGVVKAVEGEPSEHTHANIGAELAAAHSAASSGGLGECLALDVEPKVLKVAPRGGRKLTSRR